MIDTLIKRASVRAVVWLAVTALVLVWWIVAYGISADTPDTVKAEATIYVILAMSALAFPLGAVWAIALALTAALVPQLQSSVWLSVLVYWGGAVILGYLQWFVLIPLVKARRARATHAPQQ